MICKFNPKGLSMRLRHVSLIIIALVMRGINMFLINLVAEQRGTSPYKAQVLSKGMF